MLLQPPNPSADPGGNNLNILAHLQVAVQKAPGYHRTEPHHNKGSVDGQTGPVPRSWWRDLAAELCQRAL